MQHYVRYMWCIIDTRVKLLGISIGEEFVDLRILKGGQFEMMRKTFCCSIALFWVLVAAPGMCAKWYEGGTLHDGKVSSWLIASDANQLATAGDFMAGTTAPDQLRAQSQMNLKRAAQAVADCITSFSQAGVFDRNMAIEEAAMVCLKDSQKKFPFFLSKEGTDPQKQPHGAAGEKEQKDKDSITGQPWDMAKAKPLPYAVVEAKKEHRAAIGRIKLLLRIVPVAKGKDGMLQPLHGQDKLTKEQLAATAVAAAKYHAQLTGAHMVSVALQTQFFPNHGAARLATVDYAPDGKGVSGKDNWRWHMFSAAEAGPTDAALKAEKPGALYLPMEQAPAAIGDTVEAVAPLK